MCPATETTSDSLDDKREEQPQEFKMPLIMTIKDHTCTPTCEAARQTRSRCMFLVKKSCNLR